MFNNIWKNMLGRETLITADNTWGLLMVMCIGVYIAILLEQRYKWAAKISGIMISLLIAMLLSNLGVIPGSCTLYNDVVWDFLVPLSLPMLLLQCDLKKIWTGTRRLIILFLFGAAGTCAGAVLAFYLLRNSYQSIDDLKTVAAMMTGTYIGGSVNFAAMAVQFKADETLIAAATVADNFLMAAYFFILAGMAGAGFMRKLFHHPLIEACELNAQEQKEPLKTSKYWAGKEISLKDIAINFAYAVFVVFIAKAIAGFFAGFEDSSLLMNFVTKFLGSQYVWITTISVSIATLAAKKVEKINGSQELGTYMIYMFLFAIGVPANLYIVITKSPLMLVMTGIMVIMNMLFCFIGARIMKYNLEEAIIASNANIGGPTTAAGMAISQGWTPLIGPAMLIGTFGYMLGNYLGVVVALALV